MNAEPNALALPAGPKPAFDRGVAARALVLGRRTPTNERLAAAFRASGFDGVLHEPASSPRVGPGDVVLARLDVLPTLDGIEDGLRALSRAQRAGATVLNGPRALLNAHDKLATALVLARAGVRHPRTAHVSEPRAPRDFGPPYVVKPRFGSWGRDVFLCETGAALLGCLASLGRRRWFRTHGALVQELVPPSGLDLRIVIAGGRVVGAVERIAPSGEWRTNVAVGARRRPVDPPAEARLTALGAVAAVGSDLAGVDLVTGPDGAYVVLEVNGAVEFTTDYAIRGLDPFSAAARALGFNRAPRGMVAARQSMGGEPNSPIRVLIADEQPLFARSLEALLEYDDRVEVVGRARDGREAVELAASLTPDVVLMDISMPVMDGFEATRRIRATGSDAKVIVLTGSDSRGDVTRARNAGADGYVAKARIGSDLLDAILTATS